jgi:hypothetical protein
MDRVTVLRGSSPVLIVAPHGHDLDDTNTSQLSELIAGLTNAHLVANNGWRRHATVDSLLGLANCNNADHVQEDVVKDEFLDPIETAIEAMLTDNDDPFSAAPAEPLVLMIHGIGNRVRKTVGEPKLDVIVGYGNGDKPRPTCNKHRRQFFTDLLSLKLATFEGKAGGDYSAHSYKNVTQFIRRSFGIDVLQLELVGALREKAALDKTAKHIASVIEFMDQMPAKYERNPAKIAIKEV